jgi:hypothetical protein
MYSVSLSQRRAHSDELRAHSPRAERCSEMAGMRRRCQLTVGVNNMRSSPDLMEHLPEVMKSTPASGGGGSLLSRRENRVRVCTRTAVGAHWSDDLPVEFLRALSPARGEMCMCDMVYGCALWGTGRTVGKL